MARRAAPAAMSRLRGSLGERRANALQLLERRVALLRQALHDDVVARHGTNVRGGRRGNGDARHRSDPRSRTGAAPPVGGSRPDENERSASPRGKVSQSAGRAPIYGRAAAFDADVLDCLVPVKLPRPECAATPTVACRTVKAMRDSCWSEDDAMIGKTLSQALQQDGYAVDWVTDGQAGRLALDTGERRAMRCVLLTSACRAKSGLDLLEGDPRAPATRCGC